MWHIRQPCRSYAALALVKMTAMDIPINNELPSFLERSGELIAVRFNAGFKAGARPIASVKIHPHVLGDRLPLPASLT